MIGRMKQRLPLFALWASLAYTVIATAITGKMSFDHIRAFHQGAAQASGPMDLISPAWVTQQADKAAGQFMVIWLATWLGLLFITGSSVWLALVKLPVQNPDAMPESN
jgi:hypothetical protein